MDPLGSRDGLGCIGCCYQAVEIVVSALALRAKVADEVSRPPGLLRRVVLAEPPNDAFMRSDSHGSVVDWRAPLNEIARPMQSRVVGAAHGAPNVYFATLIKGEPLRLRKEFVRCAAHVAQGSLL